MNLKFGAALCAATLVSGCIFESDGAAPVTLGVVATTMLPTGQMMSPLAAPGSTYTTLNPGLQDNPTLPAGFAQSEVLSPDGKIKSVRWRYGR